MQIIEYFESNNKEHWLNEINKCEWDGGKFLYYLLNENKFRELCGKTAKILLLTQDNNLISFCSYADQDDIADPSIKPWVGFVYTYPQYRGKKRIGKLLEYAYILAKQDSYKHIYISTNATGLYEKFGYSFWNIMEDIHGCDSRIYRNEIETKDYSNIIGTYVSGKIDRPIGSFHPNYPELIYPINYGYIDGVLSKDGEYQDAYILGTNEKISSFHGQVIGVYHRLNDNEDKWIVKINDKPISKDDILKTIDFQEQYFMGELYI